MLAGGERAIERPRAVGRLGDVERLQRQRAAVAAARAPVGCRRRALRAPGTKTLKRFFSTYRNGASRETGVVGSVVLSPGLPKSVGGAPSTPLNTKFAARPLQLPIWLSRT